VKGAARPLILCLGSADRGDDAQGPCCADLLERQGVPARLVAGQASELLDYFRAHPHIILVDAIVTGKHPPGYLHRVDGAPEAVAPFAPSCHAHGFGLEGALRLGAALKTLPKRLTILGIESASFEWGATPSAPVAAAIEPLAAAVASAYRGAPS
jgi:hydrogenase maturation protease